MLGVLLLLAGWLGRALVLGAHWAGVWASGRLYRVCKLLGALVSRWPRGVALSRLGTTGRRGLARALVQLAGRVQLGAREDSRDVSAAAGGPIVGSRRPRVP